jgi:probable F420-dependent oxidoreductase
VKFGLFGINMGVCSEPAAVAEVARAAEAAGFESVWTGEHVVLPDPQQPPSPLPPRFPLLDPAVALAFVAAQTRAIRLGTGIIILPQRNPLVLAKELASVDVLSNGRLIFGLGVGYLKSEFDALGAPFAHKGARADEYLAAMQAVWSQDNPAYEGRFVSFAGIQSRPHPVQRPGPPVVVGGRSPEAFKRAVRCGQGWYGFALDLAGTAHCLEQLRIAAAEVARAPALGALEISVTPAETLDPDIVARYAALGVHRLIPYPRVKALQPLLDFIAATGNDLITRA